MQQDNKAIQLPCVADEVAFPGGGGSSKFTEWIVERKKEFDSVLFEVE